MTTGGVVAVVLLSVLVVAQLAGAVVLLRRVRALRERVAVTGAELTQLRAELGAAPELVRTAPAHPLLTVEILNAPELAARESWAARRFGSLVPRVVNREVAAQAARQMAAQLESQGVRAHVRIVEPEQR